MQKYLNALFLIIIFALAIYIVRGQLKDEIKKLSEAVAAQQQAITAAQNNIQQVIDFLNKQQAAQQSSVRPPRPEGGQRGVGAPEPQPQSPATSTPNNQ